MDEPHDVDEIMERIRETIRRRRQEEASSGIKTYSDGQIGADLGLLHSGYDVYNVHFTSHRKVLGPIVLFAKKILRQLLTPILLRQVSYNASNARIASYLKEQLDGFGQRQERLEKQVRDWGENVSHSTRELERLRESLTDFDRRVSQLEVDNAAIRAEQLDRASKRLAQLEGEVSRILPFLANMEKPQEQSLVRSTNGSPDPNLSAAFDYFAFEERFRGSEQDIKERQRTYLDHFVGKRDVLDVGCGRGEFLELLREAGIKGKGVDVNLHMVLRCREKGLEVAQQDAFAYLEASPDESLGGIFASQVVEHLESNQMVRLIRLCYQKLCREGVLIVETLNPESLPVHCKWFWMDLTHVRLIHPDTLKFVFETSGFSDVVCEFAPPPAGSPLFPPLELQDCPPETLTRFNQAADQLNKLLYGSCDYAVIGSK
jgi:O-antigen chain-terminating methyltransferase